LVTVVYIIDSEGTESSSAVEDINNSDTAFPFFIPEKIADMDFLLKKRTKRRKFKSYFGKSYEQS